MNYIKEVTIKNFQSHEFTVLQFNAEVNTIIGASDSGKTAIIRAICWALFNDLSGDYYVRKGTNDTFVQIVFSDSFCVLRGRKGSKNYYDITLPSGEQKHYEGIGTTVPSEILEYTGIQKINLDNKNLIKLNVSSQLEAPFLLSESPGFKSTALGKLAGIDIVDTAQAQLRRDIYGIQAKRKFLLEEKSKEENLLTQFANLKEESEKLESIKKLRDSLQQSLRRMQYLKTIQDQLIKQNDEIEFYKKITLKYKNLDEQYERYHKVMQYCSRQQLLIQLSKRWNTVKKEMHNMLTVLSQTKDISSCDKNYMQIVNFYHSILILNQLKQNLTQINKELQSCRKNIRRYQTDHYQSSLFQITILTQQYNKLVPIFNKWKLLDKRVRNGIQYIKKFETLQDAETNINKMEKLFSYYTSCLVIRKQNIQLQHENSQQKENLKQINTKLQYLLNQYEKNIRATEICPFCYNKIDEDHIEQLLKEYIE